MPDVRPFPTVEQLSTALAGVLKAASGSVAVAQAGVDYQAASTHLNAIANLIAQGFLSHTGGGSFVVRSIVGTTNQVTVSHPLGILDNPTISLPQNIHTGATPTFAQVTLSNAPSAASDAATKSYVDSVSIGLDVKASVRAASTANVALTGGATLTVDGVALANGNRVLLKDQSAGAQNGIYTVAGIGSGYALTRATDADANAEVTSGLFTFVTEGTANGNKGFVLTTDDPITLDTTALTFAQFSASSGGVSIGDSVGSATAGSLFYAGTAGILAQDNANLFYDATNLRLGIGTNSPSRGVHVKSAAANGIGAGVRIDTTAGGGNYWEFLSAGSGLMAFGSLYMGNADGATMIVNTNGEYILGRAIQDNASRGQLTVYSRTAGTVGIVVVQAGSPTADPFQIRANDGTTVISSFAPGGGWKPPSMADADAPNNTVYKSTDANKLVYKDSGGVVNNLY